MRIALLLLTLVLLSGCGGAWNNPYPAEDRGRNILYRAFTDRPKHLDPVQSYSEDEAAIIMQIYEPPLQYHFLKRPFTLIPLAAEAMPSVTFLDRDGRPLPPDATDVAQTVYEIRIRAGVRYQPHPAFARDEQGRLRYHALSAEDLEPIYSVADFPYTGTRELTAEDYVYQIKRLAHPRLHSPSFAVVGDYIVGLRALQKALVEETKRLAAQGTPGAWIDLGRFPLEGVEATGPYSYRIKLQGRYPQFVYWLAMPFFAPMPVEVDRFFSQPGMAEKNLTLDWYPVGTGPYMLTENNPNARMVLERNPNFRGEPYPEEGEPGDAAAGMLADAGRPMPFVDRIVLSREKEGIPYWNKFLQGYYDSSGISSDAFDQAVRVEVGGDTRVTPEMEEKGIRLTTSARPSIWYLGFNFLDPVVGGASPRARKLRQAISIAIDWEEYLSIFANGRGIVAHGPIPPGLFGYREGAEGVNPVVFDARDGAPRRRSIETAKQLMAEAGYPNGLDARGNQPLVLYFDSPATGPDAKSSFDWLRKQFAKLGIQLEIRGTDYNRFQDKMRKGTAQMFEWGWNADYPDPENFLFLFYGPQARARNGGENTANYENAEFDGLFERMKAMDNGPERQMLIDRMVAMLREDAVWSFGFFAKSFRLDHAWVKNVKPNPMARNDAKYRRVDPTLREQKRAQWNQPVLWPVALFVVLIVVTALPAVRTWRRRERMAARPGAGAAAD